MGYVFVSCVFECGLKDERRIAEGYRDHIPPMNIIGLSESLDKAKDLFGPLSSTQKFAVYDIFIENGNVMENIVNFPVAFFWDPSTLENPKVIFLKLWKNVMINIAPPLIVC